MAELSLQHVDKIYDNNVQAVFDFNLDVKDKEFIVFVGPSGCGKSTTLRMIAGLEEISAGDFYIDGKRMNDVEPKDRDIAMVFQSYALYPHMSVYENMAFGLKLRKFSKEEIDKRVHEAARILEIEPYLDRKPKALSGGQRQRVALGRAIVRNAKVFLMDEPLSNLDAKLRVQMRSEIIQLHERIGATTIYVTHDQTEAMTMADRIVVMKGGYIQQIGSPKEIYNNPANLFVAGFLGAPATNFIKGVYKNGFFYVDDMKIDIPLMYHEKLSSYQGKEIIMGIRPEAIHDEEMYLSASSTGFIDVTVDVTELMGAETYLYVNCQGANLVARVSPRTVARAGDQIKMVIEANKVHLFDKETETTICN